MRRLPRYETISGTFFLPLRNTTQSRMKRPFEHDDQILIGRVRAGREDAVAAVYARCSGPIYRFVLHMTANASLAEEITQETFLELLSRNVCYEAEKGSLLGWLLGVARNKARSVLREAFDFDSIDETDTDEFAREHDILGEFTKKEVVASLRQAIASLPPAYREVVLLCEMQELGYTEAATILECPVGTVRSRLHRAKRMLVLKLKSRCLV